MKPLHTGITLALTLIVFYSLCTLIAVLWHAQFMQFTNALFHGLDFGKLQTDAPYSWGAFFQALVVFAVWGFAVGTFFAWLHNTVSNIFRN
ncbi:MAG: hypothetical protein EPO06_09650 [Burkholderiaceae bacterium]|nr:MAG: hypothetical protein EPO06_09650 [Burkholderiaceae bacterium]